MSVDVTELLMTPSTIGSLLAGVGALGSIVAGATLLVPKISRKLMPLPKESRLVDFLPFEAMMADGKTITTKRSEEHTSELQSLMRISYAVFCLKKQTTKKRKTTTYKK